MHCRIFLRQGMEYSKVIRFLFFAAVFAVLISSHTAYSKRSTSRTRRPPQRRIPTARPGVTKTRYPTQRAPQVPNPRNQPRTNLPPGHPDQFGGQRPTKNNPPNKRKKPSNPSKGFVNTLGKITIATYLARNMKPSLTFTPHKKGRKTPLQSCHECVSVNGSDISCEEGFSHEGGDVKKCPTSKDKLYCLTERGIASGNVPYMRRTCGRKDCEGCSSQLRNMIEGSPEVCYPVRCDVCNWNYCNNEMVEEVFTEWTKPVTGSEGETSGESVTQSMGQQEQETYPEATTSGTSTTSTNGIVTVVTFLSLSFSFS